MHYEYLIKSPSGSAGGPSLNLSPKPPTPATTAEAPHAEVAPLQIPAAGASPAAAISPRSPSHDSLKAGMSNLSLVQLYHDLITGAPPLSGKDAARRLGVDDVTIWRLHRKWLAQGCTLDAVTPQHHKAGRPRKHQLTPQEIQTLKARKLLINRTRTSSSTPEALRQAARHGELTPETMAIVARCEAAGQPIPESILHDTYVPETAICAYRNPRNAWLDKVQSPGSLMLTIDEATGQERFWKPGEAWTIDDGTINLGVCVPLQRPGDKCWQNFKVIVGRFQLIPIVDHMTRCILGFNYTCRPKSSYRAEDLTATMQTVFMQHGLPRVMFLEHGASASNLVRETLSLLHIRPIYCASPHQKVVEMLFDTIWLKLSSLPGQVGRFRGEMETESKIYESCKKGEKDPRKYFPMITDLLQAIITAIHEINQQWVNSPQYGRWQPGPWFEKDAPAVLRPVAPGSEWMFSPVVTDPLVVRGMTKATSFSFMDGLSIQFHFYAPFLGDIPGAMVRLYYNPFSPQCSATVVLADEYQGRPAGTVLGTAKQTNRHAKHTRRAFGYGDDVDTGLAEAKAQSQDLRRHVQAILPNGKPGIQSIETRSFAPTNTGRDALPRVPDTSPKPTETPAPRNTDLLDRQAARARKLMLLSEQP